ncbi:zinc ribbon domain-containing protein [Brevibacillus sp. NRS-1366]|uniref:zinc ribbon domain-containing protein n=1 Tax=Brevibacillus sp. NRS-1366 TaxID=3233899 RepID=UPI003D1FAEF5
MQNIVRTIDTTEAFRLKVQQLETELQKREKELVRLEDTGMLTSASGSFQNFIGTLAYTASFFVIVICLFTAMVANRDGGVYIYFAVFFGGICFYFGRRWKKGSREKHREAEEKRRSVEERKVQVREEIENLRTEIKQQQDFINKHMLNQQELLNQEIKAIQNASQMSDAVGSDTKECPQCAEIIKAKARICRYCNFKFDQ